MDTPIKLAAAARMLGMHVKSLQRLDVNGRFKARRTATGRRYYTQADLDAFLGVKPASGTKK